MCSTNDRSSVAKSLAHQEEPASGLESQRFVELLRPLIVAFYFQMNRPNPQRFRSRLQVMHDLCTDALPTIASLKVQFIKKRIPPMKFKTVAKSEHGVTNGLTVGTNEPNLPKLFVSQQVCQRSA